MKSPISTLALCAGLLAWSFASISCETTGNPREGGIFWSEKKAQDRLDERQNKLDDLHGQTRKVESDSARTQRKINAY
jgi:hypothetical protein